MTSGLLSERMRTILSEKLPDRTTAELHLQTEECLRFLTIASELPESFFPLTREVDDVWHELISETREYQRLCSALPGGRFLHHSALTLTEYAEQRDRRTVVAQLLAWIPNYVQRFGDFTEERAEHWMICNFLRRELGLSLEQINQLGRGGAVQGP